MVKGLITIATYSVFLTMGIQKHKTVNSVLTGVHEKSTSGRAILSNVSENLTDTTPKIASVGVVAGKEKAEGVTGKITGKIINAKTGEPISGANITLKNGGVTRNIRSDYNGVYSVGELPEGVYTLTVSHLSYGKKQLEDIKVIRKDVTTQDIVLEESKGKNLDEVVVSTKGAGRIKESVSALLIQQKNAASVSDGISAEAIKRTPDKTTSDIMKRVSGASIQEDKFVIIRGLNDRYNAAFINNAPLPSSESDRKAFSFDVFPANMLDNLIIVKTATPDMPGEFAGGLIFINTKDIPAKSFQSLSFGLGYNTMATFKERKYEQPGGLDWLGLDDGKRKLPSNIPSTNLKNLTTDEKGKLGQSLNNNWATNSGKAPMNYNMQYVKGWNIQRKEKDFLGVLLSATYNKTLNMTDGERKSFNGKNVSTNTYQSIFSEKIYSSQVLAGLMGNISLKLNENNKISFKNLVSVNSDDRIIDRVGDAENTGEFTTFSKVQWFTSNTILSSQLGGEHFWKQAKIKINWTGGYTSSDREIPNLRKTSSYYSNSDPSVVSQSVSTESSISNHESSGSIFTSTTKENIRSFGADFLRMFRIDNFNTIQLKAGAYIQGRSRDFSARYLSVIQLGSWSTFDNSLLTLPDNKVFAAENFGLQKSGKYGFGLSEDVNPDNAYTASSSLSAYYFMLDTRFLKFIRLNGGLRVEKFDQVLNSSSSSANTTITDNLPSANLIVSLNSKQNLRFSYSQTLNRPEYRELAPFIFYDNVTRLSINGNTKLDRVKIENYDCRYEFYPTGGQLLSLSLFQKNIPNPIEFVITPNSDAKYINAVGGKITGVEFECRANIGSTLKSSSSSFLSHTTLFGNAAIINSEVSFGKDSVIYGGKRSMQGQSPYIYNAGVTYQNPKGYSGTLQINYSAPRVYIGPGTDNAAIFENGRQVLDLQLAKTFEKQNIEVKLNVKDILAKDFLRFYDIDNDGKYDSNKDRVFSRASLGSVISASITYKF